MFAPLVGKSTVGLSWNTLAVPRKSNLLKSPAMMTGLFGNEDSICSNDD